MTFWTRNKATLTLTALLVLVGGGMYISGAHCGSGCLITSLFTTNTAYAGPGCSAEAKGACTTPCDAKKTNATTAEAKTAEVTTASATDGKACADKETCIAKCMAEKGMTRAEAEECWAKCQASMTAGKSCNGGVNIIKTAAAGEYSREAYIDACVARGMDKVEAAKMADKKNLKSMDCPAAAKASTDGTAAGCCASKAKASTSTAASGASN